MTPAETTGTSGAPHVPDAARPLAGLRIVELSSFVATPLAGTTLRQLGAEVIRVEQKGGAPDRTRWPVTDEGTSLYWTGLNPGKQSVEVDLTDPRGRRLVSDLIVGGGEIGGIVIANNERWQELNYPALRERRPDVIHVLLNGTHDGGTAVDYVVQAKSGFPWITGPAEHGGPVNQLVPAWDIAAGLYLANGLLAAELHRRATGEGSEVRVALEDVGFAAAGYLGYLAEAQIRPETPRTREGNYVYGTFGRDFTTSDGDRIMIVALTPRQWKDLLRVTGLGETVDALGRALGADFFDEGDRYRHRVVLAGLIAEWFGRHDTAEVTAALETTRVLWSPYRTFTDLAADDSRILREMPLFDTFEQPGVGTLVAPGSPMVVNGHRTPPAPAPNVGQDTGDVLTALGVDADELAALVADGVVGDGTPPGA